LDKSIILSGLTVGTFIALLIILSNMFGLQVPSKPWGIHAGVWGLTANCMIIFILYQRKIRTKP